MFNLKNPKSQIPNPKSAIQSGFTLLELVVVLTIVGMASALALPTLGDGLRQWRMQGAVRELATLFKFTRNQSVAQRVPFQVVLDRARGVYWLDHPEKFALFDPERGGERGIRLYALPAGFRFGEAAVAGIPSAGERVGILFFPKGNSTGGEIEILDPKGRRYRIVVDPLTGQARVHR